MQIGDYNSFGIFSKKHPLGEMNFFETLIWWQRDGKIVFY